MNSGRNEQSNILVVLTGGTICSSVNAEGIRYSDAANVEIIQNFQTGQSPFSGKIVFTAKTPLDILSENMTINSWNVLLQFFRTEVDWNAYQGVIVLHGTDTLAYTSSLLSIALAGVPVPICMVSSQLPLSFAETNGHANFRAAVELIMNGIAPNVYAVYRNMDQRMYVHYGAHLLQCGNYSQDFFSVDAVQIDVTESAKFSGKSFETDAVLIRELTNLSPCVMQITPYVGIRYDAYCLDGVRAVVHGTFHSESVCVERKNGQGAYSEYSVISLLDRCRERGIPVFLAPCSTDAYRYESTGDALNQGAYNISNTTFEMAYVKTLVGCALGYDETELQHFVNTSVNHECVYRV